MASTGRFGGWTGTALWHLAGASVLIVVASQLGLGQPAWRLERLDLARVALVGAAYLCAILILALARFRRPYLYALPIVTGVFGALALATVLSAQTYPRVVLGIGVAGSVALATLSFAQGWVRSLTLAGLLMTGAGTIISARWPPPKTPAVSVRQVQTALAAVQVSTYTNYLPASHAAGGGIIAFGRGALIVDGDGRFEYVEWGADDALAASVLTLRVPINAEEFREIAPPEAFKDTFRVGDLIAQEVPEGLRLFVVHHYWVRDSKCWVVRVSETTLPGYDVRDVSGTGQWRTVFESRPCMPFASGAKGPLFMGIQIGGAMAFVSPNRLLVALGDQELDGVNSERAVSQDPTTDYGKIIEIDLTTGSATHFTTGHRNPQGLTMDSQGRIWLAEHGPQGGDELNRIEQGLDYGWPSVTYGTEYGSVPWPLSKTPGTHDGYQPPTYSWVPSIGSSALIEAGAAIPAWTHDLLIASLHGQSLFRMRIRDDRAAYVEPIHVGQRIRDLVELRDGRLVLWTDRGILLTVASSRIADEGARVFGSCAPCHPVVDGRSHGVGPDLAGGYRRRIAVAPGFAYSPALLKLDGRWDDQKLTEYLKNPQAFAPGTAMDFKGMRDPGELSALISYLKTLEPR